MKKTDKSANLTSVIANKSKDRRPLNSEKCKWIERYLNHFQGKLEPVPDSFLNQIAEEILHHAKTSDVLRIEWFFTERNMRPASGTEWSKRHEGFKEAYKDALYILGMRREKKAMDRDTSEGITLKSLYLFDPFYEQVRQDDIAVKKDIAIEVAKAKVIAEQNNTPSTIYLGDIPGLKEHIAKKKEDIQSLMDEVE